MMLSCKNDTFFEIQFHPKYTFVQKRTHPNDTFIEKSFHSKTEKKSSEEKSIFRTWSGVPLCQFVLPRSSAFSFGPPSRPSPLDLPLRFSFRFTPCATCKFEKIDASNLIIFAREDRQQREERMKIVAWEEQSAIFLGHPSFGVPLFGVPPFRESTFGWNWLWTKVSLDENVLDESVIEWKSFWMKVSFWMKTSLNESELWMKAFLSESVFYWSIVRPFWIFRPLSSCHL